MTCAIRPGIRRPAGRLLPVTCRSFPPALLQSNSMFSRTLVVLAVLACTQARPQQLLFGQPSSSSGNSGSTITKGETIGPGGISTITEQKAGTGGNAFGGGFNFGTATGSTQNTRGPFGNGNSAITDTESVQGSVPGFPFGGGFPVIPGFPSSATGSSNSALTKGETIGPDGSKTTITQLGSQTGGTAQNGGTNVGSASGSTSSTDGFLGSNQQSKLDTVSTQTGR